MAKEGRKGGKGKKGIHSQMVKTLGKDTDVGELRALSGLTTFDDFQFASLNGTEEMTGQRWEHDEDMDGWVLRKEDKTIPAVWQGEREKVGQNEEVLYVRKDLQSAIQAEIGRAHRGV